MIDPVLAYAGPESRSIDVLAILFDGTADDVRGVIGNAETSAGEAGAPFGEFGALCWIAFDGDPKRIEFVQYVDPATGDHLHRRAIKAERIGVAFNTVKIHMASDATVLQGGRLFDPADFSSVDFQTDRRREKKRSVKAPG